MTQVFDAYSAYYDLFYRDKDYLAEVAYVRDLFSRYGRDINKLLEFGSGTGIHGKIFAGAGYTVTGIELSQKMVDRTEEAKGFTSRQGDIRSVRLEHSFDAVISLFHVMSYQVTNSDIQAALSTAAVHLLTGGIFVFDFWYTPAVYTQSPEVRVKRMEGEEVKITRIAEPLVYPNLNRVDVHYSIYVQDKCSGGGQVIEEVHSMRHFSLPELDFLSAAAGFETIGVEEFLTGEVPSEHTWGVCVILRKL